MIRNEALILSLILMALKNKMNSDTFISLDRFSYSFNKTKCLSGHNS